MGSESQCESCMWYDTDWYTGEMVCMMDMDEDERLRLRMESRHSPRKGCPYYRYYHEYKSVQKQN